MPRLLSWGLIRDRDHMDRLDGNEGIKVRRPSTVWPRIAGSLAGLLIGGVHLGAVGFGLAALLASTVFRDAGLGLAFTALILSPILAALLGSTIGAALGAVLMQRWMRRRSSYRRTMLAAIVGMLAGSPPVLIGGPQVLLVAGIPIASAMIVAGAVIGSGWKAKPVDGP